MQKRVVSAYSLIFSLFIFSSSRATETRSAILSCDRSFFFPQLYNNTELSDRVISTPPLLNSIRHDTWLFLEAFRHRDRFSPLFESRVCPDRCAIRASVCSRMHERARSLPPLFSDGENTDLGTTRAYISIYRFGELDPSLELTCSRELAQLFALEFVSIRSRILSCSVSIIEKLINFRL